MAGRLTNNVVFWEITKSYFQNVLSSFHQCKEIHVRKLYGRTYPKFNFFFCDGHLSLAHHKIKINQALDSPKIEMLYSPSLGYIGYKNRT